MYLVIDEASQEAAVVDPYDAKKIQAAVKEKGANVCPSSRSTISSKVTTLITTHHHDDHSGMLSVTSIKLTLQGGNQAFVSSIKLGTLTVACNAERGHQGLRRVKTGTRDQHHRQGGIHFQDWSRH